MCYIIITNMTLTKFLLSVGSVSVFSWVAWVTVLFYIDPEISGIMGVFVFYASLFFALLGTFTLFGLSVRMAMRRIHHNTAIAFKYISPSIRQSVWFSLAIIACLMLSAAKLFNWWSVVILFIALVVLEGFYLSKQDSSDRNRPIHSS